MKQETINAIIADDEPLARDVIRNYLADFPDIKIIAECENGLTALEKVNALKPDLLFLDIQMPDLDGFSLLEELKTFPSIIFTTAFSQYAMKAFEVNAVDYLLKPFDKERFHKAVMKVLDKKNQDSSSTLINLQNSINELLSADKKYVSKILIKGKENYSFVNVSEILWFEAFSDYVKIHLTDKILVKNTSLNVLESKLDPKVFMRIHRSTIVNVSYIKELTPYFNGEYYLFLTNGEKLKLSRSYKEKLKAIIDETI